MAFIVAPAAPGKVTLKSPELGITTPNNWPSFTWSAASNATWYLLWVNDSTGNPINQWYSAATNCSGETCSAAPGIPLASGAVTLVGSELES